MFRHFGHHEVSNYKMLGETFITIVISILHTTCFGILAIMRCIELQNAVRNIHYNCNFNITYYMFRHFGHHEVYRITKCCEKHSLQL